MEVIAVFAVIAAVPPAIGGIVDRLLLDRTKGAMHDRLLRIWVRLDDTTIPDLPALMARVGLRAASTILASNRGWLFTVGRCTLFSFVITGLALWIGWNVEDVRGETTIGFLARYQGGCTALLTINLVFDLLTVWISWRVLKYICEHSVLPSLFVIALDLALALGLAVFCGTTVLLWDGSAHTFGEAFSLATRCLTSLSTLRPLRTSELTVGLYSSTSLIPTVSYMLLLLLMYASKPLLTFGQWFLQYFLERATQVDDPKELIVFTLLGGLWTVLAVVSGAVYRIVVILCG